jgi:hypothetical protein
LDWAILRLRQPHPAAPGLAALRWLRRPFALLVLALTLNFTVNVLGAYRFTALTWRDSPYVPLIETLTDPGERIQVAPYAPHLYLATRRLPATSYEFFFPWEAIDPRTADDFLGQLRANPPPLVIFQGQELVNGQFRAAEWEPELVAFLAQGYESLDPAHPLLSNVYVRRDRLADARDRLRRGPASAAGAYTGSAP